MGNPSALLLPPFGFSKPSVGGLLDPLGLKPKSPSLPPAPPAPPKADDPAVVEARKKARLSATKRKGRSSLILTGGAGVIGAAPLSQPQALGA